MINISHFVYNLCCQNNCSSLNACLICINIREFKFSACTEGDYGFKNVEMYFVGLPGTENIYLYSFCKVTLFYYYWDPKIIFFNIWRSAYLLYTHRIRTLQSLYKRDKYWPSYASITDAKSLTQPPRLTNDRTFDRLLGGLQLEKQRYFCHSTVPNPYFHMWYTHLQNMGQDD